MSSCLLDSGAEICLLPSCYADPDKLTPASLPLLAVNNTSLIVEGSISLPVTCKDRRTCAVFYVSPNIDEVILGRDWLSKNGVVWNFAEKSVTIQGRTFALRSKQSSGAVCKRCVTQADVTIAPRSEAVVPAYVIYSRLPARHTNQQWSTTLAAPASGVRVARTLVNSESGSIAVRMCNITERPVSLYRGCTISPFQPVCTLNTAQPDVELIQPVVPDHITPILESVDNSVPTDTKLQLESLLCAYADVFSRNEYDLGETTLQQHRIDTGSNRPFRQALRPQPRTHLPVIDKLLQEMQEQKVIEPCQSEWASNIVLVKKKDGSIRFCVDYRKLNLLTTRDAYPLPRIDRCLETLAGSSWFSTFDLRSGFHQVPVDPRDINKTTFICHRGTFRFPKMPFGLCNAPSTFQRLMDTVLTNLDHEICLAYLDDIIVFSSNPESHLERLQRLFDRLREAGLKLKPSKCHILQREVSFLGFRVNNSGVGTDPDKITAIRDWPVPTNLKQSRAFVGLCQYYRKFVPQFSEIAAPLHALTKKNASFQWTEQCDRAFNQLKQILMSAEVLALPREEGQYILDCDASDLATGAVLSQIQDGVERPICYASQLYSKHEQNYNVTRKELLAVITYVRKFRQYLLGCPFTIRTDHAALHWLKSTPEPIGQQARWLEILEEFDYTIVHRPGRLHGNADAMSRRVGATRTAETSNNNDPIDWPELQKGDTQLRIVYDMIKGGLPKPSPDAITAYSAEVKTLCSHYDRLRISTNGTLCRDFSDRTTGRQHPQIIVPFQLRQQVAIDMHKGLNGGHLGTKRAKAQLQKRFFWPGWSADVRLAKQRCQRCARFQKPRPSRQGELQPLLTGEPWERLGIDVTGPHPTSSKGNVYILTVIDHFTKWVELFPMRNQEAATVAKIIVDRVICVHGCPLQILTDQGPNFESNLFQELCRLLAIDKIRTTAYQPSTNGNIERFHATMHSMIAKWVSQNQRNWDQTLPAVAFAYRTSVQESTGFTPFFLMHGREARIPADLVYGLPPSDSPTHYSEFALEQQTLFHEAFEVTRQNLGSAARRRKRQYDLRTRPQAFKPGDLVWCLVPRRRTGRYNKWQSPYQGPFEILRQLGPVNFEIKRNARSKPWIVHVDKLKLCYNSDDQEQCPATDEPVDEAEQAKSKRPQREIRRPARFC